MKQELNKLFLQHRESLKSDYWSSYDKTSEFGPLSLKANALQNRIPVVKFSQNSGKIRKIQSSRIPEKIPESNTRSEVEIMSTDPTQDLNFKKSGSNVQYQNPLLDQNLNFGDTGQLITFEGANQPDKLNFGDSTSQTQRSHNLAQNRYSSELEIIHMDNYNLVEGIEDTECQKAISSNQTVDLSNTKKDNFIDLSD